MRGDEIPPQYSKNHMKGDEIPSCGAHTHPMCKGRIPGIWYAIYYSACVCIVRLDVLCNYFLIILLFDLLQSNIIISKYTYSKAFRKNNMQVYIFISKAWCKGSQLSRISLVALIKGEFSFFLSKEKKRNVNIKNKWK